MCRTGRRELTQTGTWRDMVSSAPMNTRCIGYNRRGYDVSCPNSEEILSSITGIKKSVGDDLVAFLRFMVDEVGIIQRQHCKLVLVGWSAGNWPMLSAYSRLDSFDPREKELLTTLISQIIFYQPPAGNGLAINRTTQGLSS